MSHIKSFLNKFTDKINGAFETFGGFFICLNIWDVWTSKTVAGVSWIAVAFFTLWGFWNLFYYPKLGQRMSFMGSAFVAVANVVWLALLIYYGGVF